MNRKLWMGWISLIAGSTVLAQSPALRAGISVEMAVTRSATLMREADQAAARIVTVARSGAVYLDVAPVTLAVLTGELRSAHATVYLKADAGAPYVSVAGVLRAFRTSGAGSANLLTSQRDPADGRNAPPRGVEVFFGALPDSGEKAVALDIAGPVSFGDVVSLIDASRTTGAKVFFR